MKDKYISLSWSFIRDKSTTMSEKCILMEISNLSMLDKGCIADNSHFASLMGVKVEAVSRLINSLVKKGFITSEIKPGSRNHYRRITINKMLFDPKQNVITPLTKCSETKENITNNIIYIVEYLNNATNKQFKSTTPKTKSLIVARSKEGFTVDDFKTVIDTKVAEWKNNDKMSQYLKPDPLFGTKFEGYLNQATTTTNTAIEGWQ